MAPYQYTVPPPQSATMNMEAFGDYDMQNFSFSAVDNPLQHDDPRVLERVLENVVLNLEKSTTSQNEHGQRSEERMVELHALLTEIHNMLQHQQSLNEASKQIDSIWVKATDNGARLEEISARLEENRVSLDGIKEQAQKQLSRYEGLTRVLYTKGQEGIKNAVAKMEETKATVIRTLDAVMETQDLAGQTHEIGKKLRDIFTI